MDVPLRFLAGVILVGGLILGMILLLGVLGLSVVADYLGHPLRPVQALRRWRERQCLGRPSMTRRDRRRFRREARRAIGTVTRPGALAAYTRAERRHGGQDRST